MKRYIKSSIAALLVVVILVATYVPVIAVGQPSSYSNKKNSGERDVVCTTLNGTSALNYYTGSNAYDTLSNKKSSEIISALRSLMTSTHTYNSSYDDCKNYAGETDCENENGKVVLLYTSVTSTESVANSGWNREHVWPKSLGGYQTSGAGSDLHHIRPSDNRVNSCRGNLKYGYVSSGKDATGGNAASGVSGGTYGSGYFEPLDNVKGDVARICLYMYVRYGADSRYTCQNITTVFQSIDVLLEWCEMDPVDTWEMGRNEVIEEIQGNRNVFIDYPEYAWLIFGKSVPSDMQTPSGKAMSGNQGGTVTPDPDTPVDPDTPDDPDSPLYSSPVEGQAYKLYLEQKGLNKTLYFNGAMSSGKYLATTESESSAVDIYFESVSGGYNIYFVKDGVKTYINAEPYLKDNGYAGCHFNLVSKPTCVWTYNTELGILEVYGEIDGKHDTFFAGTYGTYNTISLSGAYYKNQIADGTQYPAYISVSEGSSEAPHIHSYVDGKCQCGATDPNYVPPCTHANTEIKNSSEALCFKEGYTGDTYCKDCGVKLSSGSVIEAIGSHNFGDWTVTSGGEIARHCLTCGYEEYLTVDVLLASVDNEAEKILLLLILGGSNSALLDQLSNQ